MRGKMWIAVQIARKKRLAAQHARMQKQLTEKQARDKAEEEKQDAQHDLRLAHRERMEAWKSGKKVWATFLPPCIPLTSSSPRTGLRT